MKNPPDGQPLRSHRKGRTGGQCALEAQCAARMQDAARAKELENSRRLQEAQARQEHEDLVRESADRERRATGNTTLSGPSY